MIASASPLLVISSERIAYETRRWEEISAAEMQWRKTWRRRVLLLTLRCGVTYVVGGVLAWGSLAMTGEVAQIPFWGGLLLSNAGPLAFGYAFYMHETGMWTD